MAVENIESHMAYACECGSVHFNLRKDMKIECYKCHKSFGSWSDKDQQARDYAAGLAKGIRSMGAGKTGEGS